MGCYFLLQGIFLNQGLNSDLLHGQGDSLPLSHLESHKEETFKHNVRGSGILKECSFIDAVTNYCKRSHLKQHKFIVTVLEVRSFTEL